MRRNERRNRASPVWGNLAGVLIQSDLRLIVLRDGLASLRRPAALVTSAPAPGMTCHPSEVVRCDGRGAVVGERLPSGDVLDVLLLRAVTLTPARDSGGRR